MVEVDVRPEPPNLAAQWMMGNLATLLADHGPAWPGCADDLTDEVAAGLRMSESLYNLRTAAVAEELRILANEEMARAFEEVDLIIAATRSEEHTSELQSLMRITYAVFCLQKKIKKINNQN